MLPMEPVEDLDANYNAINKFTKSFPYAVVLNPGHCMYKKFTSRDALSRLHFARTILWFIAVLQASWQHPEHRLCFPRSLSMRIEMETL